MYLGTTVSLDHFSVLCNRAVARQQMIRNCCIQQAGLKHRTFGFPPHLMQCFLSLGHPILRCLWREAPFNLNAALISLTFQCLTLQLKCSLNVFVCVM